MITAFSRSFSPAPKAIPMAALTAQLRGRTYPISRHGVWDQRAQIRARTALPGTNNTFPANTTRMAIIPTGPKPRSLRAKLLSSGVAALADPGSSIFRSGASLLIFCSHEPGLAYANVLRASLHEYANRLT